MTPTHDGSTPHDHQGHRAGPAPLAQWLGLLLAPAAFFTHLQVGYVLVMGACHGETATVWNHVAAVAGILVAGLGIVAAWVAWTKSDNAEADDAFGVVPRTRLLAATGLGVSSLLCLVLITQWIMIITGPMCP